jgi:pimeloyl-ACP methyl ester carboxylesterase
MARAAAAALVGLLLAAGTACRQQPPPTTGGDVPVIFVHGLMGSGAQYRSQGMRWTSNGFPAERIRVFNYNTASLADVGGLNALVDQVRTQFNVSRVNLVGHSLGTGVVNSYVSGNAAKVNRFALVDGLGCPAGNSACIAIRAGEMGQTHVEASVSAESFERQYRHFMGRAPATTAITPEPPGQVRISGYALELQTNVRVAGATGTVYAINSQSGQRTGQPAGTFTVGADGRWGPVSVVGGQPYEIAISRGEGRTAHYYFQGFARSTDLVHLITSPQGRGSDLNTNKGPGHSAMVIQRQSEIWRSHGAQNDTIQITAPGQQPADVLRNVRGDVIGLHLHDDQATPRVSSLSLLPWFSSQAFQNGVDVYMPAANPPNGTISIVNAPRGNTSNLQRVNVPNWPSDTDAIIVELNDDVT